MSTKLQCKRRWARYLRSIRRTSVRMAGDHRRGGSHHACGVCGSRYVRLYRSYGCFLRDEDIRCNAHVPAGGAFWVPLVEAPDGSVWGYTSCPQSDIDRWIRLPDADASGPVWSAGKWTDTARAS